LFDHVDNHNVKSKLMNKINFRDSRYLFFWLTQLGVALLYFLFGLIIHQTFRVLGAVSIIWPGSGLALAALIIGGRRYIWGVCLGSLLLNVTTSTSLWGLGGITLANVMGPLVAITLLTRYGQPTTSLRTISDYLKLITLGGAFASAVSAVIGTLSLLLAGYIKLANLVEVMFHWWMGDTLGVLLVTPLVLSWQQEWLKNIPRRRILEGLLLMGITFVVGQIVFFDWFQEYLSATPKGYLLFLCVAWVAIRMGTRSTTLVLLLVEIGRAHV
jgi:integral membrane sensor domain MASE1